MVALQLTKSSIECVILAGSSLFRRFSEIAIDWWSNWSSLARAARDFLKDFDVIAPEDPIFSLVPMAHGRHGTVMGIFLAPPEPNPCPYSYNDRYS